MFKWNYKYHSILLRPLKLVKRITWFLESLSWEYAHHRNGDMSTKFPSTDSHWATIRNKWNSSKHEISM